MADKAITGISAQGLEGAKSVVDVLGIVGATSAGADWIGGERDDGSSNAEVVQWLKDGGRDISATKDDQQKAADLLAEEIVRQMNRVKNSPKAIHEANMRQAKAGIVGGLRKAAKHIAAEMYSRVKSSAGKAVTKEYARARHLKFGVADDVNLVFTASRQLGEALQKGTIKIRIDTAAIGRALPFLT